MTTRSQARLRLVETLPHGAPSPLSRATPIVKWVGGKGRIVAQLAPLLPPGADLMRHVEPFAGGAAFFFARRPARALLADVNRALVRTYELVRDDVEGVLRHLRKLAAQHDVSSYYVVRDRYNHSRISDTERAAMFIYLNKTCFNGLHRVNRRGEFNVPAGRYKSPRIVDDENLRAASLALRSAEIVCAGFEALLAAARPGDFVYMDPPYEPLSQTASFTAYAQDGFARGDQTRLRDVFRELDRRGCKLMLSNSDVPFVRELYKSYRVDVVLAPRAVSCDASTRTAVTEVVVRNY